MNESIATSTAENQAPTRTRRSKFFVCMSALLLIIMLAGFAETLYLRAYLEQPDMPMHLYVHGVVLTAWYLLFLAQTSLVASHRTDLHRRLGVIGAVLAVGVVAVSVATLVARSQSIYALGFDEPTRLPAGNLLTVIAFSTCVVAAITLRHRSAAHKRLMLIASISIIGPALDRLARFPPLNEFFGVAFAWFPAPPEIAFAAVANLSLLLVVVPLYDFVSERRLHRGTVGGLLCVFVAAPALSAALTLGGVWQYFVSSEAHPLGLRAQAVAAGGDFSTAHRLLDEAITIDPEFTMAYGMKAQLYRVNLLHNIQRGNLDSAELESLMLQNARRVSALSPHAKILDSFLAVTHMYSWRWKEAEAALERARAQGWAGLGYEHVNSMFKSLTGDHEEGIQVAREFRNFKPDSPSFHQQLSTRYMWAGNLDAAIVEMGEASRLAPENVFHYEDLALMEAVRGNTGDAQRWLTRADQLSSGGVEFSASRLASRVYVYGRLGETDEALRRFKLFETWAATNLVGTGDWAIAYLGIGDYQRARVWLERGAQNASTRQPDAGFWNLVHLSINWINDPILERSDFADLRSRILPTGQTP